ncbi:hypothetical protein GUJ93_ZPchr0009g211 [Zizania palustris]|uniref:Uncharacterized protein n=1 Tax=Zizania palustris TaxID=103762 RepID=A0A8J5VKU0_ZIZPA|nr:hypothetical protein GUJ93_ZPchr0009g211 [Zizania palustris]
MAPCLHGRHHLVAVLPGNIQFTILQGNTIHRKAPSSAAQRLGILSVRQQDVLISLFIIKKRLISVYVQAITFERKC